MMDEEVSSMVKRLLLALGTAGLLAIVVKEIPAMMREVKIWRMGHAPQGPAWFQRPGGG
jgi:hypothetical protein